jgi:hypothetical protein
MSEQVFGGSGGGACPKCGGFPPNCRCYAEAVERAKAMADVAVLEQQRQELCRQLGEVNAKVNAYRVKCQTCRCRILPWDVCRCCAEPACVEDESPI